MADYRMLPHTADIMIMVEGASLDDLFKRAGESLSSIVLDRRRIRKRSKEQAVLTGSGSEELLFHFLRWIHFLIFAENFLVRRAEGKIDTAGNTCRAVAWGESYEEGRHIFKTEVKAVTYHNLRIERRGEGYRAIFILDV
jgi:SHS2 domain-containing protein